MFLIPFPRDMCGRCFFFQASGGPYLASTKSTSNRFSYGQQKLKAGVEFTIPYRRAVCNYQNNLYSFFEGAAIYIYIYIEIYIYIHIICIRHVISVQWPFCHPKFAAQRNARSSFNMSLSQRLLPSTMEARLGTRYRIPLHQGHKVCPYDRYKLGWNNSYK